MRRALSLLALLAIAVPGWGQDSPDLKVLQALGPDRNIVQHWGISISSESAWVITKKAESSPHTQIAFTDLKDRMTYIRESYVQKASIADLRFALLHEAGHLACGCSSEGFANSFASARR